MIQKFKQYIRNFDYFELGNSFVLYYIMIFSSMPIAVFLSLPSNYVKYFIDEGTLLWNSVILFYLALGILAFIIGYNYLGKKVKSNTIPNIFNKEWNYKRTFFVFGALLIVDLLIKSLQILNGAYFHLGKNLLFLSSAFYSIVGFLNWFGLIALAIAFVYYFYLLQKDDNRYKIWQIMAWSMFSFQFLYGFLSGGRFLVIVPIVIYLLIKHYTWKKSYARVIIAGFFIFAILMPVTNYYKQSFYNYTVELFEPEQEVLVIQFKAKDFSEFSHQVFNYRPPAILHHGIIEGTIRYIVDSSIV